MMRRNLFWSCSVFCISCTLIHTSFLSFGEMSFILLKILTVSLTWVSSHSYTPVIYRLVLFSVLDSLHIPFLGYFRSNTFFERSISSTLSWSSDIIYSNQTNMLECQRHFPMNPRSLFLLLWFCEPFFQRYFIKFLFHVQNCFHYFIQFFICVFLVLIQSFVRILFEFFKHILICVLKFLFCQLNSFSHRTLHEVSDFLWECVFFVIHVCVSATGPRHLDLCWLCFLVLLSGLPSAEWLFGIYLLFSQLIML